MDSMEIRTDSTETAVDTNGTVLVNAVHPEAEDERGRCSGINRTDRHGRLF